jgi:predicted lysophospholipase L1 biosynthesis ABC-type transport system permease subunit
LITMANRVVIVYDSTFREMAHKYYQKTDWKAERDILCRLAKQYPESTMMDIYLVDSDYEETLIRSESAEELRANPSD